MNTSIDSESVETDSGKVPDKIILFLTRNFDKGLIAYEAKTCPSQSIYDFFIKDGYTSDCLSNIYNPDGLKTDSITSFWETFRNKFNTSNAVLHPYFDGNLKRLEINNSKTGIFFYHHWFDQQFSPKNTDVVKFFVEAILEDIKTCFDCKKIPELHLIMHDGDFIDSEDEKKNLTPEKIETYIKKIVSKVTIYSFHHQRNNRIYDKVLNNADLFIQLRKGANGTLTIEEYVLGLFDPEVINKSFENLLNQ